jgi:hypothetical protein
MKNSFIHIREEELPLFCLQTPDFIATKPFPLPVIAGKAQYTVIPTDGVSYFTGSSTLLQTLRIMSSQRSGAAICQDCHKT